MDAQDMEAFVERLGYDFSNFDIDDFVAHAERLARRPIQLRRASATHDISGFWVRTPRHHYVVYNIRVHTVQQIHSILHEIGHILLGHPCERIDDIFTPEQLAAFGLTRPEGRLRQVSSLLDPDPYDREAEAFVFCLQRRIVTADRLAVLMGESTSIDRLRKHVDMMAFEAE